MGMKTSAIKALNSAPTINWNGSPGIPYENLDTVNANHNSIVMVSINDTSTLTINLPVITPASAGKKIEVLNTLGGVAQPGTLLLIVNAANFIEWLSPLEDYTSISTGGAGNQFHFALVSDGVDNWSFVYPRSGISQLSVTP